MRQRDCYPYMGRAAKGFLDLIVKEQRKYRTKPRMDEVVEIRAFNPVRVGKEKTSKDHTGGFTKSVGYEDGRGRCTHRCGSTRQRSGELARIVDEADGVDLWVRLHTGDLPILWTSGGQQYNPDFIVVEKDGTHWIVEVKADRDMTSDVVQGKREAAKRWANHVTDGAKAASWHYLLVSESDIETAKGSWELP